MIVYVIQIVMDILFVGVMETVIITKSFVRK